MRRVGSLLPNRASVKGGTLGTRTSAGFLWLLANGLSSKVIQMGSQLVLAWLLVPADFGLVGLAYTVTAFTSVLEQGGVRDVLVQRQRHLHGWVNPAFWIALTTGLLSAGCIVGLAPVAAMIYGRNELTGMLLIMALASPLTSLQNVTKALLQIDLRFEVVAATGIMQSVGQAALSIFFAWRGFGAFSFVLPRPILAAATLGVQWWLTRPKIRRNPEFKLWKYLFTDTVKVFAAALVLTITAQGDYIVLGLTQPAAVVGLYFFAFNLSMQSVALLGINLSGVLFPALSKLQHDKTKQAKAYLKAVQAMVIIGLPAAMLQFLLAAPLIRLLYERHWHPAIPVLEILSIGMMFRLVGTTAGSLLSAQGRFGLRFLLSCLYAVLFVVLVSAASLVGGLVQVALAVAVYYALVGIIHPRIVIAHAGLGWTPIFRLFVPGIIAGGAAVLVALIAGSGLPVTRIGDVGRAAVRLFTFCGLYFVLIRMLAPAAVTEFQTRIRSLLSSFLPRAGRAIAASGAQRPRA